jgi:hypothetical protein
MNEHTNNQRAERAKAALQAYKDYEREGGEPDCDEDVSDLLTDLHHYLLKYGKANGVTDAETAKAGIYNLLETAIEDFDSEYANAKEKPNAEDKTS